MSGITSRHSGAYGSPFLDVSHGCDFKAIAQAIEEAAGVKLGSGLTKNVKRIFPYTDGNSVTRTDKHTGDYAGKRMSQTKGSTAEGAPLYVGKPAGDPKTLTVVFVEGEGGVDPLVSLGYRAITWRGGAAALGRWGAGALGRSGTLPLTCLFSKDITTTWRYGRMITKWASRR